MKNILNIIWCSSDSIFSFDWVNEIFGHFEIKHHFDKDNNFNLFYDNSIILVCPSIDYDPKLYDYIQTYNTRNLNYCILHVSDEGFQHNVEFYKISKKILRNYYNKQYSEKYNIKTIPLGYQSGIKYKPLPKDCFVNFVGQMKSDRYQMLKSFNNVTHKYFFLTNIFNDPNGLNIDNYSELLSRSVFTLCPRGFVSLDSFRINEALECKSIPITVLDVDGSDYFKHIYGEHPFIVGKDWNDSFQIMTTVDSQIKLKEINEWWIEFKKNLLMEIEDYVLS
jgi:hypothetical protein